jgi:hypothetical protein
MALWGNQDALASAPKWIARIDTFDGSNASVVNTSANTIALQGSTNFSTGDALVYTNGGGTAITGLTSGNTYYARRIDAFNIELFDTYAHAIATYSQTGLVTLSAVGAGTAHTLQRDPTKANPFGRANGGSTTFLVTKEEAQAPENRAIGIKSAGWWKYLTFTASDNSVRHKVEKIVALQGEITEAFANYITNNDPLVSGDITITAQPSNASVTHPATATFTIAASITGNGTIGYQWYRQANGTGSFSAISGATSASYTTGATTVLTNNGDVYYCVLSAADYNSVQSALVILTVA